MMHSDTSDVTKVDTYDEAKEKLEEIYKESGKDKFCVLIFVDPYSFTNINLGLGNFELINEARKLLGLGEEVTLDEIKKAYYELSHRYHPDKFQGNEEQMKKIAQAYSILENYCQSCDEISGMGENLPAGRQVQKYSFKEEDVKNSIMIKYA